MDHSLDRSKFRSSEMPQAFQYEVIKRAYDQCTEYDFDYGTECLHLAQKYADTRALLIDGPESLWKVTYRKDLHSVEGVLRERQAQSVVIVGKSLGSFHDNLNEHLHKRNVVVSHLQEEQTSVEPLVSETRSRLMDSTTGVSVVFVADNKRSDEKPSSGAGNQSYLPDGIKCFLQEISQRCSSCKVKRLRLVNVRFSDSKSDFNTLKVTTEEMKACAHDQGIVCFGVFAFCPVLNNQQDEAALSKLIERAAELTTTAVLDAPSGFNGQTFDTIT